MFAVTIMSGKYYAMETVNCLGDFYVDDEEMLRYQTFIDEGTPVIICDDLDTLREALPEDSIIEVIEKE